MNIIIKRNLTAGRRRALPSPVAGAAFPSVVVVWSHHCIPIPIPFVIAAFALLLGMVGVVCYSSSLGVELVHGRVISFVENEKETKKKTHQGGREDISWPPPLLSLFRFVPLHHHCVPTPLSFGVVGPAPLVLCDHLVATSLSHGSASSLVVDLYGRDSC
jgi:hypothetical protein